MHWNRLQVGDRIHLRGRRTSEEHTVQVAIILEPTASEGRGFVADDGVTYRRFHFDAEYTKGYRPGLYSTPPAKEPRARWILQAVQLRLYRAHAAQHPEVDPHDVTGPIALYARELQARVNAVDRRPARQRELAQQLELELEYGELIQGADRDLQD